MAVAALLFVTAPRPTLAATYGFSLAATGGQLRESGRVMPAPTHPGATVAPDMEMDLAVVVGRFRPTFFGRVTGSMADRPVRFSYLGDSVTGTANTLEPAFGLGLALEPDPRRSWFVRADVFPFFPLFLHSTGADIQVAPRNRVGIGLRGSAGLCFGPLVMSLVGEYDYWASRANVGLYMPDPYFYGPFTRRVAERYVDFLTSVFRIGVCVGARVTLGEGGRGWLR